MYLRVRSLYSSLGKPHVSAQGNSITVLVFDGLCVQVVQNYPQVPAEWKNDQSHARSFAVFYETHVSKGRYKMNEEGKVS